MASDVGIRATYKLNYINFRGIMKSHRGVAGASSWWSKPQKERMTNQKKLFHYSFTGAVLFNLTLLGLAVRKKEVDWKLIPRGYFQYQNERHNSPGKHIKRVSETRKMINYCNFAFNFITLLCLLLMCYTAMCMFFGVFNDVMLFWNKAEEHKNCENNFLSENEFLNWK